MTRYFLLAFVCFSSLVWGAGPFRFEIDSNHVFAIDERTSPPTRILIGEVTVVPAGTTLYHWGPEVLKDWAKAGFPDDEGMQRRRAVSGFYVSARSNGWGYGPVVIVYEMKRALRLSHLNQHAGGIIDYGSSLEWGAALMHWEDEVGLDGHDDGFGSEDKALAVNHPDDVIVPHLGTVEDIYRSADFQTGQLTLRDFLSMEPSFPFEPGAQWAKHYPQIDKLLAGRALTPDEEKAFRTELPWAIDAIGWLVHEHKTPGPLSRALRDRYRTEIIAILKAARPWLGTQAPTEEMSWGLEYFGYPKDAQPGLFKAPGPKLPGCAAGFTGFAR